MDFPLISFDPDTGIAYVGIPQVPRNLRGIDKVVQIVCIAILKNRGQDVFDTEAGTGLRAMIGQFNYSDPNEIKIEVIQRISQIEKQIINNQTGFNLPSSEKLSKLTVLSVVSDAVTGNTAVQVKVTNEAGQSTVAVV